MTAWSEAQPEWQVNSAMSLSIPMALSAVAEIAAAGKSSLQIAPRFKTTTRLSRKTRAVQLARGVRMVVGGLAPEAIIFIGEFTSAWDRFKPILERELAGPGIYSSPVTLLAGQDGAAARLRGTVGARSSQTLRNFTASIEIKKIVKYITADSGIQPPILVISL